MKILYANFRCPSELHVRPKLFSPGTFQPDFYIHLLFPLAPCASNFYLKPLSHYTEAAGRCHMDGGDERAGGFLLLFSSPFVLCQPTQNACRKRGVTLSTFMCTEWLEGNTGKYYTERKSMGRLFGASAEVVVQVLRELPHLVTAGSRPNCCSTPLERLGNASCAGELLVEASLLTLLPLFPDPTTCVSETQRRIEGASCSCKKDLLTQDGSPCINSYKTQLFRINSCSCRTPSPRLCKTATHCIKFYTWMDTGTSH